MGAANCCKKPDEIVIEEIAGNNDNEYPEDTQQNHRTNPNEQEENMRINATSNQNLYEQDIVSPKIGGAYEVPINVPSPQHNYIQGEGEEAYEQNEMGSPEQYEQNHVEEVNINQNQYEIEDKNINVIENSNNYNMQEGNGSNMVGLDLNSLTNVNASQQGGVDLNNLALRNQQGNIGVTEQQTTTTTTTTLIPMAASCLRRVWPPISSLPQGVSARSTHRNIWHPLQTSSFRTSFGRVRSSRSTCSMTVPWKLCRESVSISSVFALPLTFKRNLSACISFINTD